MRIYDVIKNETDALNGGFGTKSVMAWKFTGEDFYDKSQLIVNEAEEAVFYRDGMALQTFTGGRYTLSTANHPFLTNLRNRLSSGDNAFNCEVYFVNKDHKLELLWGTDTPIQMRDPVLRLQTSIQARGSYSIQVSDSKKFLVKLIGNNIQMFTQEEVNAYFRSAFLQNIKDAIAKHIKDSGQEILEVCTDKGAIAASLKAQLAEILDEYGVELINFYVAAIDIPETDPNRGKLEEAFADKGVMGILGEDWARQKSANILSDLANNPGSGGIAAAGAGMGMGIGAAGVFNDMAKQMVSPPTIPTPQPPGGAGGVASGGVQGSRFLPKTEDAGSACTACSAALAPGAKFCAECGTPTSISCSSCNASLPASAKFCAECGTPTGGQS